MLFTISNTLAFWTKLRFDQQSQQVSNFFIEETLNNDHQATRYKIQYDLSYHCQNEILVQI